MLYLNKIVNMEMTFLKDILTTFIGLSVPLLVFYLTVRNDTEKEQKRQNSINNNRIAYFSSLIKSSIKHVQDTIENLEKIINQFDNDNITFHLMPLSPNQSFGRLSEVVKSEDLFLAYNQKFSSGTADEFTQIALSIDFFKMQLDQLVEMHKLSQSFDFERKLQYKKDLEQAMRLLYEVSSLSEITLEYRERLDKYLIEYHDNHPKDFSEKTSFEYSYSFIRKVLDDTLIKNQHLQIVEEAAFKIKDASMIYNEIINQNNTYKQDLISLKVSLVDNLQRYKNEVEIIINQ